MQSFLFFLLQKEGISVKDLQRFMDEQGRLTSCPAKRKLKLKFLVYLSQKFGKDVIYTEKQINQIIDQWHTYGDPVTWRRELVDHKILSRDDYGREYKLASLPTLEELLAMWGWYHKENQLHNDNSIYT